MIQAGIIIWKLRVKIFEVIAHLTSLSLVFRPSRRLIWMMHSWLCFSPRQALPQGLFSLRILDISYNCSTNNFANHFHPFPTGKLFESCNRHIADFGSLIN